MVLLVLNSTFESPPVQETKPQPGEKDEKKKEEDVLEGEVEPRVRRFTKCCAWHEICTWR